MSELRRVRVGVVGYGAIGRHHARVLAEHVDVDLAWIVDIDGVRADEGAAATGARSATDVRDVIDDVDAVTVAVPTGAHLEVALACLERGRATLVEKPLAGSATVGRQLVEAAAASGSVLAVGHTERFNPAVVAALPLAADPRFVEVHRLGSFPQRSLDVDVVLDVMIHDLDVILALVPSPVVDIDAVGVDVLTDRVDIANVRLRFESGCIANLTASRISRDRVRKIRWFQRDAYVSIDYATHHVEHWRLVRTPDRPPQIQGGAVPVPDAEPLVDELADFIRAARLGEAPRVDGAAGLRALELAERIASVMGASAGGRA